MTDSKGFEPLPAYLAKVRLINLKRHIDYFSKGPKSDRAQKRRLFRVNSILRFCHNEKHEMQHVGLIVCPFMLISLTVETSGRGSHAFESCDCPQNHYF